MKKIFFEFVFCLSVVVATPVVAQESYSATSTPNIMYQYIGEESPSIEEYFGLEEPELIPQVATSTASGTPLESFRIDISIDKQELRVIENYQIIHKFPTSTGLRKGSTPKGIFKVQNHALNPVSRTYGCHLYRWLAVTPSGSIGIHGLFMTGYEKKLGHPASHGCIRLSRPNAEIVYNWAFSYKKTNGVYPQVYIH